MGTFVINLIESVIIVVVILMLAMGFKSGIIIGISLIVTVFGSFLFLYTADGTMQRVSLAAFVLAMGMLVDNAIVIVDGILVDLKAGKNRMEAMTAIGRQTAMPLLGATLIAIIAFLPIFLSPDTAGLYTRDLFIVLAVSLLLSWVLALVHVPLMANRKLHPAVEVSATESANTRDVLYASLRTALYFDWHIAGASYWRCSPCWDFPFSATATCGRVSSPIWCTTSSTWSTSCPKAITPPAWHAI
ncbi:MAG: efflux RND transporter permease subunit [Bacteroides stercoris]